MASEQKKLLHVLFFPFMSPGHFVPMVDMARLFAQRPGVKATIVTTPGNAPAARRAIDHHRIKTTRGPTTIDLLLIPFPPPSQTGLPDDCRENLSALPSSCFEAFLAAMFLFRDALDRVLQEHRPDCLVSDSLFTWTADLAEEAGIPRLIFHGAGAFPLYVMNQLIHYLPLLGGDEEKAFTIEGLPHPIRLTKSGLPELIDNQAMCRLLGVAEDKSYGVVVNTFREMEPTYTDYLKGKKKTWCVGPVSLCNRDDDDKAGRGAGGDGPDSAAEAIRRWLDGREPQSVLYVCFGSLCDFSTAQLGEIALGLEGSGHPFLWVLRAQAGREEEPLPEGFEERTAGRGLVVRGWAPQVAVLAHPATGCFVTHCGWNSLQEAVCAGVPMITWPLFHEQFINEILLVEVMGVGARMWEGFRRNRLEENQVLVKAEEIAGKVARVMAGGGEEEEEEEDTAQCMRRKAKEFAEMANRALEEGGSTYEDIGRLVDELRLTRNKREGGD